MIPMIAKMCNIGINAATNLLKCVVCNTATGANADKLSLQRTAASIGQRTKI